MKFRQSLLRLLQSGAKAEDRLLSQVAAAQRRGQPVCSTLISILTHLDFSESQAQRHWRRMLEHRRQMKRALKRDPGLRVALVDYFVNRTRVLKNPKVIEIALYQRTEQSALTDALTGLFNRAYLMHALRRELSRASRHGLPMAVALFDIDDFKHVNDSYGHLEGDRVLVRVAGLVGECLREVDTAARYGGEEFAVLLPDTPRRGAYVVADRIRARIHEELRTHRTRVTISGGVATYPEDGLTPEQLLHRADQGLYRAKAEGKNRIADGYDERRSHVRLACEHPVRVQRSGARRAVAARTLNLSEGGLLVSLREQVPVGSRVTVVVRPGGDDTLALRGEVVRLTRRSGKLYDMGVRLARDETGQQALVMRRLVPGVVTGANA